VKSVVLAVILYSLPKE